MAAMFIVLCVQALLIQSALSQCTNAAAFDGPGGFGPYGLPGRSWAFDGLGYDGLPLSAPCGLPGRGHAYDGLIADSVWPTRGLACGGPAVDFTPTSGGALPVTSASAIPPTGISILSENVYDGILSVTGEVPFVGTTVMDGIIPTLGAGAINYGCGTGVTAMVSEALAPGFAPGAIFAPGVFGPAAAFNPSASPVTGEVPFVGTTGMDGIIPTLGAGAINYGCGTGVTAMVSEALAPGFAPGAIFAPGVFGPAAAFNPSALGPAGFGPISPTGI